MSRVIADGLSKRVTATPQEAEDAVEGKYPDAAGVHAAFKQYGLGAELIPLAAGVDLNTLTKTGFFYVYSNAVSKPSTSGGYIINNVYTPNYVSQVFITATTSVKNYIRSQYNSVWTPWREIYHQDSILGTVSQSAGVPTGAIIERGSNANGEYVRFADGTLLMRRGVLIDISVDTDQDFSYPSSSAVYESAVGSLNAGSISLFSERLAASKYHLRAANTIWRVAFPEPDTAAGNRNFTLFAYARWY